MISSAEQFLAFASLKRGKLEVRGQVVHFRELSVGERAGVVAAASNAAELPALVVAICVTDPDGKALFSKEQAAEIAASAPEVVDAVAAEILKLSGLADKEGADAKNA